FPQLSPTINTLRPAKAGLFPLRFRRPDMAPPLAANSVLFPSHTFRAYRRPSGNYAAPARERQHNFRAGDSGTLSVVTENKRLTRLFSGEFATTRAALRIRIRWSCP